MTKATESRGVAGGLSALLVMALSGVARAEGAAAAGDDGGPTALVVAATVAWVLLLSLVAIQFLRQRRLARRLDEIESSLASRERADNGDR